MKKEVKKSDDQLREGPVVYIYASIFDDYRTFKEFRFVTTHDVLLQTSDLCRKLISQDNHYREIVYDEAINSAFRPKVSIKDICTSFIKYICCTLSAGKLLPENPQEGLYYMAHLHLDNDDWSRCDILSRGILKKYIKIDDEFRLVGKSDVSMTLPSKLSLLNKVEMNLLDSIFATIYESNESIAKLNYGQFWDFLDAADSESKEEFTKDEIDGVLNTLIFYDFITIDHEWVNEEGEKICLFLVSINDLQTYYDLLQL